MLKIVELDIDGEVSGDTGVWEIAWVEHPAIEQELIYFGRQMFYKAPQDVASVACRAIKENEKRGNPAATQVGKVRARQLCNRDEISLETINRMKSYLERAKVYNTDNWDDNGTISWHLWGGQKALDWVDRVLETIKNKEDMAEVGPRGGIKESEKAPKSDTPNPNPKGEGTAKGSAKDTRSAKVTERVEKILKEKSDDFNEKYKDNLGYGVNVGMLKSVYQRGVGAYNTSHSPEVKSAEQWALARVNAFLYLVKNGRPENKKYDTDFDLLPSGHPKKQEDFVYPNAGESQDEFISRCVPYLINEGKETPQAVAVCYSMWDQKFSLGEKVSFDYDGVASTKRGKDFIKGLLLQGYDVHIISARSSKSEIVNDLKSLAIPANKIFAVGSNIRKIEMIESLGIKTHYDNNPDVINELRNVGEQFDYDVAALPTYNSYPDSGTTDDMLVKPILKPVLFNEECNCKKEEDFNLVGFLDGQPIFSTKEEAEIYGKNEMGCEGSHEHRDENGNLVYMACETHPTMDEDFANYDKDEIEIVKLFNELKKEGLEKFEAITDPLLRGFTFDEVVSQNHKEPTTYYLYKRVDEASGEDRDFCLSLEGRYFRRSQIDMLRDTNREFGHQQQPYSKWSYKGGPNCIHAWEQWIAQGPNFLIVGMAPGQAGIPPKQMPNQGYYNKETKRKSEVAYIISQQNMSSEVKLYDDLEPLYWVDGAPLYLDPVLASDASYLMGCGGSFESVEYEGQKLYKACAMSGKKADIQQQVFKSLEDKRMVYTPLMIPNILIPRLDDVTGERYFVRFRPEVIEKIQQKFMIEQRLRDTNYEHTDKKFNDAVMVESWIVSGDSDKAYTLGFTKEQVPQGTWMGGYKVLETPEGDEVWNKYIKTGKVKGMSVEGNFLLQFSRFAKDEYLLKQIINILNQIV